RGQDGRDGQEKTVRRALGALAIVLLIAPAVLHAQTGPVFVVETTKGNFAFETYPNEAPKTVAHVEQLVRDSFYDGQRFHRAIPGFVLQSGDPPKADSQIYVTLADRPDLDGRYTVFGHLIAGFDIPARLQRGDLILRMYVRE